MLREARSPSTVAVRPTSALAGWCLVGIVAAYVALAVVAGAPRSPITVPLPAGAAAPGWSRRLADLVGLAHASRPAMTALSVAIVVVALILFGLVLREAARGRVATGSVLLATAVSVVVAMAAPVLLSRDAISYVAYGRLVTLHHSNPYGTVLARFPSDPFVRVTSRQWIKTTSVYGPAAMLLSAAVAHIAGTSAAASIAAFKVLAGLGIAATSVCTLVAARAIRPERAALAVAIVGVNPVLIVHTVGGGHIDGVLAGLLAGALAVAVGTPPNSLARLGATNDGSVGSGRTLAPASRVLTRWVLVTVLLTVAALMRLPLLIALLMWLYWAGRAVKRGRRLRTEALLVCVVAGLAALSFAPFLSGWRSSASSVLFGGLEWWASPSHLIAHAVETGLRPVVGGGSTGVGGAVTAVFVAVFVVGACLVARRYGSGAGVEQLPDLWGVTLLLLALAWPYLLPWYAAWFLPFLGLMTDELIMWVGVGVSSVLALTLIPADPPHGLTTWGVMDLVHYAVAPTLLAAFVVVALRVARTNGLWRPGGADPVLRSGPSRL